MSRFIATLFALMTVLSASVAAACPVCASREEPSSLRWYALGVFIFSPWVIAAVIGYQIRKGTLSERSGSAALPTEGLPPTENG